MSNTFLSASSIPGGLLPSPSANLFERSIGTLLSTFKYSVADPVNSNNNVRYQQPYQQAAQAQAQAQAQYQYSQPASVNNVNIVMGPNGPVANAGNVVPVTNNHKSVKKTTLYGEMMAVKLEKENKTGTNLALPSSTTYTNITLNAPTPNVPSQNFTGDTIKPAVTASSNISSNNTFQIPPAPSQITLHSNYPPPPPPPPQGQTSTVPSQVIQINPSNNQQTVTVQDPVTGTFQNISYQQPPTNISIGSNYAQPVNKNTNNNGQTIYPSAIQIPSVNNPNFQATGSNSVSNSTSSQQPLPNQKIEENANLLSNNLQQNCTPTLNYIVGVFMDSVDSMQQNIDFFQSGNNFTKNSDGNTPKINYHPNMLTLFNDDLADENKSYAVNYNNGTGKDDSKLINEYFNWDELLSDTEKTQQANQQSQPVTLYNGIVPSQTLNVQQPLQQIAVNGQPTQLSIGNAAQPQTITVPGQLSQQTLPIQQVITPQQTPQLRTQTLQTAQGSTTAQGNLQQQQPVVVMMDSGNNYQTSVYPPQNTFVAQNTFNQPGQINTFNQQQPGQINYTNNIITTQASGTTTNSITSVEQPQTSQSLMFKGDTQDITRMTRVENTTNTTNANNNVQFYQGFDNSNNTSIQNIQSNVIYANSTNDNSGQLQDTKLINKSLDTLNSTSTSVTISNTNGTITDTANSNTTLESVATNTNNAPPPTTKPKRKERPSTKPKPFKCQTCQQTFSRSHDLKRHIYTHTGIKPFKCEKCGKSFSRRDALNRHSKGEINCIRYLNKLNNMKKQQNKAKQQQEATKV